MRKHLQLKAWILLILFVSEIFSPFHLLALSSGPSQPEMAAFTPSGTTEMVDPFTGDFTYNIPLMDVEGYPVNIAYSSGVTMEQEASWVGLGWNLNVGTINRSVRGIPDDFKGDEITSQTSMKDLVITKFGYGSTAELIGFENFNIQPGMEVSLLHNSYKGFGISYGNSIAASTLEGAPVTINSSLGFDLNTLDGTSVNSSLSASSSSQLKNSSSFFYGGSLGSGYNTRTGQSMLTFGTTAGYSPSFNTKGINPSMSYNTSLLPIGMMSYTPYPSLKLETNTFSFSGTVSGEIFGLTPGMSLTGSRTVQRVKDENASTPSFGYFYSQHANDESLKDFNRDKEVQLNKTTTNLSPTSFTYDVFSVTGEGVSGMFRPFRNDIGVLNDPAYSINSSSSNSLGLEAGIGGIFKAGANFNNVEVNAEYGPWIIGNEASHLKFKDKTLGQIFENIYFKSAGDLSQSDLEYYNSTGRDNAMAFQLAGTNTLKSLVTSNGGVLQELPQNDIYKRAARSKVLSVLTAGEAQHAALDDIVKYSGNYYSGELTDLVIPRVGGVRQEHHISEITQTNPDGNRYVFGIPAYNNSKKEVSYTTDLSPSPGGPETPTLGEGRVSYSSQEASTGNGAGIDGYYSSVSTPPYAHSFLLTAALSNDYQDITGNGISSDDIGTAHKFNYQRTSENYRWRVPYNGVSFVKGFESNKLDQKASYSFGTKEMWYLHTIESKNQIAEFHISPRKDALGSAGESGGKPAAPYTDNESFQLDYIVLYNKLDRLKNKEEATPIKRIDFTYDYSLCRNVENQKEFGKGKLTLKSIEISYGNSELGKESPYVFTYSDINPNYNPVNSDRWGNYKDKSLNPGGIGNNIFPYTLQNYDDSLDVLASAWSLEEIQLPTGGIVSIEYEADDYGYVQHKDAMQMFKVTGAGNSTTSTGSSSLYSKTFLELSSNPYLYFEKPIDVPTTSTQEELRKMFFGEEGEMSNLYFKFSTNIGKSDYDYVSGYTSADEIGLCPDTNYMYVKIIEQFPNAISKSAWGYFRQNLFEVLYNQPNVSDSGLESVLRGIVANMADIVGMIIGTENLLLEREIADKFQIGKSFIRLNSPTKFKKGGGSRVKRIIMNDQWNILSGEGQNAIYGQSYEYTTKDKNGRIISSGVASYEPMVGNDENPFRTPNPYVAQEKKGHVPAIEAYQEEPFGETLFPSASVGYSKVTVKNIHINEAKTTKGITEHSFYTAKDFPVIIKRTPLEAIDNPASKGSISFPVFSSNKLSTYTASQGYSIILNDMHGKPLSTINYGLEETDTSYIKKKISGTIYKYHHKKTTEGKVLNNKVQVLTHDGFVKNKLLGVESDIAIDSRRSYEKNVSVSTKTNVDVIPGPIVPPIITFPSPGFNRLGDVTETKTMVVTKVVQMYGIIESVKNFTDQYSITTYNELYDGTTGDVLLIRSSDEHLKDSYEYTIPAYSVGNQERMGPSYVNQGFETTIQPMSNDTFCNPNNDAYLNPGQLKHGDEVILYPKIGSPKRAWVELEQASNKPEIPCPDAEESIKQRMSTAWYDAYGAVCGDELEIDTTNFLKGERGDILQEAYIFHLKSQYTDSILALSYPSIGTNNSKHVSTDVARFLLPHKQYAVEHQRFCNTFDTVLYRGADEFQSIFDYGKDLNYEVDPTNISIRELFDDTDTIFAEVERVDVKSISYHFGKYCDYHFTDYDKRRGLGYDYSKKYYSCESNSESYEKFFSPAYSSYNKVYGADSYDPEGYNLFQFHLYKSNCDFPTYRKLYGPTDSLEIYPARRSLKSTTYSKSVFRIKYNPVTDNNLDKYLDSTQLYLVAYKIQLPEGGTDYSYFIEKGRRLHQGERSPFLADRDLNECAYDYAPYEYEVWQTDTSNLSNKPCIINYRLLDENGLYISGLNRQDTIKVIRSGNNNQLAASAGRIVSTSFPLKLDVDSSLIGIKTVSDGLEILQAEGLTFQEGQNIVNPYGTYNNPFLQGSEGVFRLDSSLRYLSPRYQKSSIETSKDGYMEELPSLWTKGSCDDRNFPPKWDESSGWFLNNSVTKYGSNGAAEESVSNLNIYASQIQNLYGQVEVVASNSEQNNIANDNFEHYYLFGSSDGSLNQKFKTLDTESYGSSTTLLASNSQDYVLIEYPSLNRLVKGVAHSGSTSLFLRGDSMNQENVTVYDTVHSILRLEQISLGVSKSDLPDSSILNYNSASTDHYSNFTKNLKLSVKQQISSLKSHGVNKDTLTLMPGDSNGLFNPNSGNYNFSIWMKELITSGTSYAGTSPEVEIISNNTSVVLKASGQSIDGWTKLEGSYTYSDQHPLHIIFKGGYWGAFYDDLRIHPVKSNLITYIYDPYSLRLKAKLDENNYATFYEYNEEGIPSQVKRETDIGVVTISESRQSLNRHPK